MTKVICKSAPALILLLAIALPCSAQTKPAQTEPAQARPSQQPPAYQYFRVGNPTDAHTKPQSGYALMGGGSDLDEAFQWLCNKANSGDLLVLRATGTDAYNEYIRKLCHLNSVATLVIPNRDAANDPFVEKKIRSANAIFLSGGDQANYINFWQHTPVQSALNDAIALGVPIGGTSAGLAVLGQYIYSAQGDQPNDPNLDAKTALADPFSPRITLVQGFLNIPILKGIVTDTHFAKRDRMGRLLVFLARLSQPNGKPLPAPGNQIRGIGVEEGSALLVEPDGRATVVGRGSAYLIDPSHGNGIPAPNTPLTFAPYAVQKISSGHTFNLKTWSGEATRYTLTVKDGVIRSTQPEGAIY